MRFRTLLAAHVPGDPPEATLVLAAMMAFGGVQVDANGMPDAVPVIPKQGDIAAELGLHRAAVARGLAALQRHDVDLRRPLRPSALEARWRARSAVVRLSDEVRKLDMRARPLLVSGVIAGAIPRRGQLVLGLRRLQGMTGLPRRTLQRAIADAELAGSFHTWRSPHTWVSCFALGCRKEAHGENVVNRRTSCREQAHPLSQRGATRTPDPPRRRTENPEQGAAVKSDSRDLESPGLSGTAAEAEPVRPAIQMQAAILRTGLRSRLRPLDRLVFAKGFATALLSNGMSHGELEQLWTLAQQCSSRDDPAGLLAHWLANDWQSVLRRRPLEVADG